MTTKQLEEFIDRYVKDCPYYETAIRDFVKGFKEYYLENDSSKNVESIKMVDKFVTKYLFVNYGLKNGAKSDIRVILKKFYKEKGYLIPDDWYETQQLVNDYWDELNGGSGSIFYDPAVYYALSSFAQHIFQNIVKRKMSVEDMKIKSNLQQCCCGYTNPMDKLYKTTEDPCDE